MPAERAAEIGNRAAITVCVILATLMQANGAARLMVILDGLDELPSHGDGQFSLADFLIPAGDLPRGCLILLTGRPSLRQGIARRMAAATCSFKGTRLE